MKRRISDKVIYSVIGVLSLVLIGISYVLENPKALKRQTVIEAKMLPTVVTVGVFGEVNLQVNGSTKTVQASVRGAGVYISPKGHILTCAHLFWLDKVQHILIKDSEGGIQKVDLLAINEGKDLALLMGNFSPVKYAKFGKPSDMKVGQVVYAIGTPLGLEYTVTRGVISYLGRKEVGNYPMNQSDTEINPGNSGGPLFNEDGEVVGIVSRMMPVIPLPIFTGLGFSVRLEEINTFLEQFRGL